MKRARVAVLVAVASFASAVWAINSDVLAPQGPDRRPELLAHRGIAQRFDETDLQADTCTAAQMLPPVHSYLENTLASMRASFEAGADIVEFDVHPTTDGHFAVFHDWTLDCRTNGSGVTREHSLAELKALDIGYGYTADGGRTFPFRGEGMGQMPSLDEVLSTFPEGRFLINVKSRDPAEGVLLSEVHGRLPPDGRARLMVYGGDEPVEALRQRLPDVLTTSRSVLRTCLLSYVAVGWTSRMPDACRGRVVFVPINVAPWLWGWPRRFVRRMEAAGSRVFLLGPYTGGDFSTGMDTSKDFARVPMGYTGGIYTNEIEAAAAAFVSSDRKLQEPAGQQLDRWLTRRHGPH